MPNNEVFANQAASTLNGGITSGQTTLVVTSATGFPTTGNFRILVDTSTNTEYMLVTAVSGTTFTVTRGIESTTGVSHLTGVTVTHVMTAGAALAIQNNQVAPITFAPVYTNTSHAIYFCDSTAEASGDYLVIHDYASTITSYVMPNPTTGRQLLFKDLTGTLEAYNIFFVPYGTETFDGAAAFALAGTAYNCTNGSPTVTASSSLFTTQLAVGNSVTFASQAGVSYVVTAIGSATSMTISPNFSGTTTTTTTGSLNSCQYQVNDGSVAWISDGTNWFSVGGYVSSLSYNGAAGGGTIAINGTGSALQWASGNTAPTFSQASTSAGSGATFTIQAQNATGGGHTGGNVAITSGTSGSSTAGTLALQVGGTAFLTVGPAGLQVPTKAVTGSSYTVDSSESDFFILVNHAGACTITLPAPTNGRLIVIKDDSGAAGTNNITIAQHASENIEGVAASYVLTTNWGSIRLTSNATDWFIW